MTAVEDLEKPRVRMREAEATAVARNGEVESQPAAFPGIAVEIVSDADELARLGTQWDALQLEHAAPSSVFQTHKWCANWYALYGADDPKIELRIAVVREDGRTVLIWPLMSVRHGPARILKWLSDPFAQYGDVLIAASDLRLSWLESAWEAVLKSGVDGISLRYVREDSVAYAFLTHKGLQPANSAAAPYLDMSAMHSVEDYSQALSGNQRHKRGKLARRLNQTGDITFNVYCGGAELDWAVAEGLNFKRAWLHQRGFKDEILTDMRFASFICALGDETRSGVTSAAGVLARDGVPLSVDIGLHYKDEYFGYLLAQDTAELKHSPVKVHLDLLQKWAVENGLRRFDLMIPSDPYKSHWANGETAVHDFIVQKNALGIAYCGIYLNWMRPRLKRLYHATPASLRRLLFRAQT